MAQQRSAEIKVGIFVAICLVIVAGMILKFGKYQRLTSKTYDITVVFPNVAGIVQDAHVLYSGITVGKVRAIQLDQKDLLNVNVRLSIFEDVKIRKNSLFVINQSGLLGDRYIDIIPQSGTMDFIAPGTTVQGSSSIDLSEAIRSVVDVLHQAAGTIERVDKAFQRFDETILSHESLEHISTAMANMDSATSNTVLFTLNLRNMIDENREGNLLTKFSNAVDGFNKASENVNKLLTANQDDARTATKNLAESAERLNAILGRLEKGKGTAGKLLMDPTLHDELVKLVRNWRKYGLLYKEGNRLDAKEPSNIQQGVPGD